MTRKVALVLVLTLAAAALGVGVTLAVRPDGGPREIVLTARGMAFYLEGDDTPNPPIAVRAGEHVRFVLRNEAAGFTHDLFIPDLKVAIDPIAAGESRAALVRVPPLAAPVTYLCRPHAQMMSGLVVPSGS